MAIQTNVEYLAERSPRPVYHASSAGRDAAHTVDRPMRPVTVTVEDARQRADRDRRDAFGLHPSGFALFDFPSVTEDYLDEAAIGSVYEAEVAEFLRTTTGARRVHIFDHTVRASDPGLRERKRVREPAALVHNDYSPRSGFTCLRETLGEEAETLARGRFQIVNVWRPLVDPVEDHPLALCDARTLAPDDLVDAERRAANHVGEIQLALHRPEHRWFYFPGMHPREVLLFRTFDSLDGGIHPCCIHTAIRLPDAPTGARPRESIETRAFVFFDEGA